MIAWLKGEITEIDENEIILDVNGVGYLVSLGSSHINEDSLKAGDVVQLPIYTIVREDDIRLFGFRDALSRRLFKILLGVNGVGPKVAQAILDTMTNEDIVRSVSLGDHSGFTSVPGVGKKTAQRVVLDIQAKISDLVATRTIILESLKTDSPQSSVNELEQLLRDATSALSNLGFGEKESIKAIKKHLETTTSLDEIIRKSLADLRQSN